jgi:IS1 family transposase
VVEEARAAGLPRNLLVCTAGTVIVLGIAIPESDSQFIKSVALINDDNQILEKRSQGGPSQVTKEQATGQVEYERANMKLERRLLRPDHQTCSLLLSSQLIATVVFI